MLLWSCGIASPDTSFIGEWHLCKESSLSKEMKGKEIFVLAITKGDKFFSVKYNIPGEPMDISHSFQLSPDKRFIFSIDNPSEVLMLNDNNTLTVAGLGQFEKK